MPAPSVPYVSIPAADYDPDSPITVDLMTAIVENIEHVRQWLAGGYTASVAHTHDGVDSTLLAGNVAGNLFMYFNYG